MNSQMHIHSPLLFIGLISIEVALTIALTWAAQKLSAHIRRGSDAQIAHAEHYRIQRRHLESLQSWEKRTVDAATTLRIAVDAFYTEAERLGRVEKFSKCGLLWTLPAAHPLTIALLAARYPDGPPPEKLAKLATSGLWGETGIDFMRF
jgi:hypothetical protein